MNIQIKDPILAGYVAAFLPDKFGLQARALIAGWKIPIIDSEDAAQWARVFRIAGENNLHPAVADKLIAVSNSLAAAILPAAEPGIH